MKKIISKLFLFSLSFLISVTLFTPVKTQALGIVENKAILVLSIEDFNVFKGCELKDESLGSIEEIGILRLAVPSDQIDERMAYYSSCPSVNNAYLENKSKLSIIPTDPSYATYQWNLTKMGMEATWDITTGSSDIIVAVIDTGVDSYSNLTDFNLNSFVLGASFLTDTSGMSFIQEDQYLGQFSYDGGSHGTAVSSVIGAELNGSKIAGIAPGVKIMPLKVFVDEMPGQEVYAYNSDVAAAIVWATEHGADIINLSLGGPSDSALQDACRYAKANGVIVVASTGNNSDHAGIWAPYYRPIHTYMSAPAVYEEVIGVGSIDRNDLISNFSNIGNSSDRMELVAYGEDIYLPWNASGNYALVDGTSFSAPTVSAVLALMLSVNPDLTPNEARAILISAADDLTGPYMTTHYDDYSGYGKVDPLESVLMSQAYNGSQDDNYNAATAIPMMAGASYTGSLSIIHDEDFFVYTVYEYSYAAFKVYPGSSEDIVLQMFDEDMNPITDARNTSGSGIYEFMYNSDKIGTYYLKVSDRDGRSYKSDYRVEFTLNNTPTSRIIASNAEGALANHGLSFSDVTLEILTGIKHTLSATKNGEAYPFPENKTFTEAGEYVITLDDVMHEPMTFDFIIRKSVIISGVGEGLIYNTPKTITFTSGTATLDGNPFVSGDIVNTEGTHVLVVTDNSIVSTITFSIDMTAPITNVIPEKIYSEAFFITFNEGTATLDGNRIFTNEHTGNQGYHKLVITDAAGNVTAVNYHILTQLYVPNDVLNPTANSITVTFDDSPYDYQIEVQMSTNSSTGFSIVGYSVPGGSLVINNLLPDTYYYFRYISRLTVDGVTRTSRGYERYTQTKSANIYLDALEYLNISPNPNFSAKIDWPAIAGAQGYELWLIGQWGNTLLTSTTSTTYTHANLSTETFYNYYRYGIRYFKTINGVKIYSYFTENSHTYTIPAPKNVNAVSKSLSTIDLTWDVMVGMSSYIIQYADTITGTVKSLTVSTNKATLTGLLPNKTYAMIIQGIIIKNSTTFYSLPCEEIYAFTVVSPPVLTGSVNGVSSLTLNWNQVTGSSGYSLSYLDKNSGEYVFGADTSQTTFSLTNLTMGQTYSFRVNAFTMISGIRYYSLDSNTISLTPAPIAITGLRNTLSTIGSLTLAWNAMEGAEGYEICQATTPTGTCTSIGTTTSTSFEKSGLLFNASYTYQVRAYLTYEGKRVYGAYSAPSTFKTSVPVVLNPTAVSKGYNSNMISWNVVAGASAYEVYRSIGTSTTYALVATVTTPTYTNTSLSTNSKYNYKVRAYKLIGTTKYYGAYSAIVSAIPLPSAPLVTVTSLSYNALKITWPVVSGASGYEVSYASTENGVYTKLALMTTNTATISNLLTNTSYFIKVRAYRTVNYVKIYGALSLVVSGKPIPNTPVLTAVSLDFDSVRVSWAAVIGATGYELYRRNAQSGLYELIQDSALLTFTNDALVTGVDTLYKVKAYRLVNTTKIYSLDSDIVTIKALPSLVTGLKTELPKYNELGLSWTAVSGASGYEIARSTTSTGTYVSLGNVEGKLTFANTGLTFNATYYYKIRAYTTVNSVKIYGSWSAYTSGKTTLETVIGQTAAYTAYNSNKISWSPVNGASGYQVYRSIKTSTTYSLIATVTSTSYTNTGLYTNTRYNYKIRAYRLIGTTKIYGPYSAIVSATPLPWNPTITVASSGYNSLKVTWPVVAGANGYEVSYATTETGIYTKLPLVTTNSATIPNLLTDTTYFIKVRAYRTVSYVKIYGAYSTIVSGKAIPSIPVMTLISNGYDSIKIAWPAVLGATGYELYKVNPSTRNFELLIDTALLTYTHTGLVSGKASEYMIKAYRLVGTTKIYSKESAISSATPIPSLVSGLRLAMPSVTSLKLAWTPVTGATGYEIFKATTSTGTYGLIKTVEGFSEYIVTGLTFNTTTYYKIRAYTTVNAVKIYGPTSVAISAKTIPSTVVLSVVNDSYTSNTLSWVAIEGASGYEIYRSIGTSATYSLLKTQTTTSYLNTALTFNTQYNYKVRAYKLVGTTKIYGAYSIIVSKKTLVSDPSAIFNSTHDSISLTWNAVTGASGYEVSIATSLNGVYTVTTQTTLSKAYTGLSTGTTYYIKLRAYRLVSTTKVYNLTPVILTITPSLQVPSIQLSGLTATSATLSWNAVSGATDYEVRIKSDAVDAQWVVEQVSALSATFDDLDMNAHYTAEVRALKKVNEVFIPSDYSPSITFSYSETS